MLQRSTQDLCLWPPSNNRVTSAGQPESCEAAAWGNRQPLEKPLEAAAAHTHIDLNLVEAVVQLQKKPVSELFQVQCMIIFVCETPRSMGFGLFRKYLELLALIWDWTWVSLQSAKCIGPEGIGLSWQMSSMRTVICDALRTGETCWETVGKDCLGRSKLWVRAELCGISFRNCNA